MRYVIGVLALCLVAGCASPPKPRQCKGEFRPVNPIEQQAAAPVGTAMTALCHAHDSEVQQRG